MPHSLQKLKINEKCSSPITTFATVQEDNPRQTVHSREIMVYIYFSDLL